MAIRVVDVRGVAFATATFGLRAAALAVRLDFSGRTLGAARTRSIGALEAAGRGFAATAAAAANSAAFEVSIRAAATTGAGDGTEAAAACSAAEAGAPARGAATTATGGGPEGVLLTAEVRGPSSAVPPAGCATNHQVATPTSAAATPPKAQNLPARRGTTTWLALMLARTLRVAADAPPGAPGFAAATDAGAAP